MKLGLWVRGLIMGLVFLTRPQFAFAQPIVVTIEAPAVQQSSFSTNPSLFRASNVFVDPFDELKAGFVSNPVPFAGNASLGSYDHLLVVSADAFGGAGGIGAYMMVSSNVNKASSPTTLTLRTPQRYVGLWWSAGDPKNVVSFYSGNTLIETFTTSDVVNFIDTQANARAFNGNPNTGQNKGKPYAFLNFYADPSNPNLTFDRIVFSNVGSARFQLDNLTIASDYTDTSGRDIYPRTPIDLGGNSNSTDKKGVEGSGSTLTDSGGTAVVGGSGNGELDILDGGTVTDGGSVIGQNPGSSGKVDVDGNGSKLTDTQNTAVIGEGGTGELDVKDGGTATDVGTVVGQNPGSAGTVDVNGPGSKLTDTGNLVLAENGSGVMDVTNGGNVSDTNATVGADKGSSGTVIVDGGGSQWNNSGSLDIGQVGTGVVDVANGGVITAGGGTIVGPNGDLMGNGTVTTPTLIDNGIMMPTGPGGTPGTLTVIGNYQQGSNGILEIAIGGPQPSQADQLKVDGSAKLNGTLEITSLNAFHPSIGDSYELLSASGTRSGQFSTIVDVANNSGLSRLDIYGPNGLIITYLPPGLLVINLTTSSPLPATLNAGNLNEFLVPLLDPTVEQLSSLYQIWFSDANMQRFNIQDRFDALAAGSTGFVSNVTSGKEVMEGKGATGGKEVTSVLQPSPENRWGVWVTGYGDFVNVEDDGLAKGYDFTTGGFTIGIDFQVTHNFVIGLTGSYSHSWTNLTPAGSIDEDSGWGGIYYGYFNRGFYVNGAVYGGHYSFESARATLLGMANGSSEGGELSTYLASGYDFHLSHLRIGPLAALQYSVARLDGFTERGSLAPLKIGSDSQDSLVTDVGFRAEDNLPVGRVILNPFVRVAWEHEYKYSTLPIIAGLTDISGSPATITGPSLGNDSAVIKAGLTVQWSQRFSTYVSYDGQLGRSRYNSNGVSGGFRYAF
jgi:outer membrane autotransporter protein